MPSNELTTYYARRASEYEGIYAKPERQRDLERLRTRIETSFGGRDVLEIACGTGYWTQSVCKSANSIVATDFNEEVLDVARGKNFGECPVTFTKADAYALESIDGPFSAAMHGFWWSHVPMRRIPEFLRVLHSKLSAGATVVLFDNRYVESSSSPIHRTDDDGNTYQVRTLADGSRYEVLKNFPTRDALSKWIEPVSTELAFEALEYFWLAKYRVKGKAGSSAEWAWR